MARERIAYREAREREHESPHEKTQRMVRERIAYHEAKAREQEEAAERKRSA
jgi:hypothetical protein